MSALQLGIIGTACAGSETKTNTHTHTDTSKSKSATTDADLAPRVRPKHEGFVHAPLLGQGGGRPRRRGAHQEPPREATQNRSPCPLRRSSPANSSGHVRTMLVAPRGGIEAARVSSQVRACSFSSARLCLHTLALSPNCTRCRVTPHARSSWRTRGRARESPCASPRHRSPSSSLGRGAGLADQTALGRPGGRQDPARRQLLRPGAWR